MKKTQHRDNALTKWLLVLTCLSFMSAPTVCANESLDADFGGFFFGDLYHVPSHHTFEGDSASGAVLRRGRSCADCCLPRIASLATSGLAGPGSRPTTRVRLKIMKWRIGFST